MQPVNISKCTMERVSSLSHLCFYSKGYKIISLGNIFQLKYYFSVSRAKARFSWAAGQKLPTEPSTRAGYVSTAAPSPQLPQHLFCSVLCMIVSTPNSIKICNYSTLWPSKLFPQLVWKKSHCRELRRPSNQSWTGPLCLGSKVACLLPGWEHYSKGSTPWSSGEF